MTLLFAITVGVLFGAGIYLMLRGSWIQAVLGLGLLGHSINLAIFVLGRLVPLAPPIMTESQASLSAQATDPLPQALILTAIVIGFAMQAFMVLLARSLKIAEEREAK